MIEWIMNNKSDLLLILTGIHTIASVIVKLTPSSKDDHILSKIMQIISLNKK